MAQNHFIDDLNANELGIVELHMALEEEFEMEMTEEEGKMVTTGKFRCLSGCCYVSAVVGSNADICCVSASGYRLGQRPLTSRDVHKWC